MQRWVERKPVGNAGRFGSKNLDMPEGMMAAAGCSHVADHLKKVKPQAKGCEECMKMGAKWLHLRMCLECGHVGCCDSSPNRHARAHFHATQHPLIQSAERGEDWKWCYIDEVYL